MRSLEGLAVHQTLLKVSTYLVAAESLISAGTLSTTDRRSIHLGALNSNEIRSRTVD